MVISYTLQLPNTRFLFVPPPPKQAVSPYPLSSRRQPQPLPHAGLRCRSPAPADLQKHGADEGIDRGSSGGGGPADALEAPEDEPALAEDGEEVQHGGAGPGCAHTSHCSAHFRRKSSFSYEASYWLLGQKRMWGKKANGEAKRGGAGREGGARGKGRRAKGGGGPGGMLRAVRGGRAVWAPRGGSGSGSGGAKLGRPLRTAAPQRSDIFRGESEGSGAGGTGRGVGTGTGCGSVRGMGGVGVMEMCGGKRGWGGGNDHSVGVPGGVERIQWGAGGIRGHPDGSRGGPGVVNGRPGGSRRPQWDG